jgi:NAD(P)H-flavin reductase
MGATELAPAEAPALAAWAGPMQPEPFAVRQVAKETGDTFTLTLVPVSGARERPFAPGQFNMLYVFGVGEVPISISGDPARPELLVHTIRAVGATTRALQKLRKGDWVGVRGPFGTAWPVGEAHGRDVVLVAGGIGLAPLRPAIYHVLLHRALYGRVVILYGARTPHDMLYPKQLRDLRSRFDVEVEVSVDRATAEWQGSVGVVTKLVQRSPFDPQSATAFICGPEVMIRYAAIALAQRGMPEAAIFVSMERNMKCAVGLCGHCQFGPFFVCKDGPVFRYDRIQRFFGMREV